MDPAPSRLGNTGTSIQIAPSTGAREKPSRGRRGRLWNWSTSTLWKMWKSREPAAARARGRSRGHSKTCCERGSAKEARWRADVFFSWARRPTLSQEGTARDEPASVGERGGESAGRARPRGARGQTRIHAAIEAPQRKALRADGFFRGPKGPRFHRTWRCRVSGGEVPARRLRYKSGAERAHGNEAW